jgi:hypothetical protein
MMAMGHVFPKNGIAIFFESHLDMQISVGFAQQIRFSAQGFSPDFLASQRAPLRKTQLICPTSASVAGRERG